MNIHRIAGLNLGLDIPPQRRLITMQKNYHAVVTMTANSKTSIMFTNHWSWTLEKEDDEYVTSLFIPGKVGDTFIGKMKKLIAL